MDTLQILIYDVVGDPWDGVTAKDVASVLAEHQQVDEVAVHINSVGGSVFDGLAIYNALVGHSATVNVHIDGIALSIASVIAQAGDERRIAEGGMMMIHNPLTFAGGEADDFRKTADWLDGLRDILANLYAARSGTDPEPWRDLMAAETWFTAAEAVAAGLADTVAGAKIPAPNAPPAFAQALALRDYEAAAEALGNVAPAFRIHKPTSKLLVPVNLFTPAQTQPDPMSDPKNTKPSLMDRVKKLFNLSEDASEEDVEKAIEEAEKEGTPAPTPDPTPDPDPAPEPDATNRVPDDAPAWAVALAEQNAKLRQDNEALQQRVGSVENRGHGEMVDAAIAEFRIPAADRDGWMQDFERNPVAAAKRLVNYKPDTVRPSTQRPRGPAGNAVDAVEISREDSRNPKRYEAARAEAREKGVQLIVLD